MNIKPVFWEENSNVQNVKFKRCRTNEANPNTIDNQTLYSCCDSNLNFSTATCSEDDCEYGPYRKSKVTRQDPMTHRIIEKRRRDRMNNCLADLSRLIPPEYLKKGRGRIEKTEIIEMAIKHMKNLQSEDRGNSAIYYRLGYQECISEVMRFMVEVEGHFPREPICVRLLNHLQNHCQEVTKNYQNYTTFSYQQSPTVEAPALPKNGVSIPLNSNAYQLSPTKPDQENSSSNDTHSSAFETVSLKCPSFEKDIGYKDTSYKYKTSIKLRFSQDLDAQHVPNGKKANDECRSSVTSTENQSSNQSFPIFNDQCSRISDTEHSNQAPCDLTTENSHRELYTSANEVNCRFPLRRKQHEDNNFDVPIFVLHTKGAYYVPLKIDYKTLLPFLRSCNILDDIPELHNLVLHPVTINVNFLSTVSRDIVLDKKFKYDPNHDFRTKMNIIS